MQRALQTSIKSASSALFFHTPSMHKMTNADFMQTFADIVQTLNRHYADYNARVHLAHFSVVNFLKVSWVLQDLRGVKETGQCWLLPGA